MQVPEWQDLAMKVKKSKLYPYTLQNSFKLAWNMHSAYADIDIITEGTELQYDLFSALKIRIRTFVRLHFDPITVDPDIILSNDNKTATRQESEYVGKFAFLNVPL